MKFISKIDWQNWLLLALMVGILSLPCFVFNFSWVYFSIMLVVDVCLIITFLTTRYELTDTDLVVKSGIIKFSIGLDRISKINMINNLWGKSCSTSTKSLEIRFGRNEYGNYTSILISPENEDKFLALIKPKLNPNVEIENKRRIKKASGKNNG